VAALDANTAVLVRKTVFATNAKDAPVAAGSTTDITTKLLTIKLFADKVSSTFSAASGTTPAPNGATVVIPAKAIQNAAGARYNNPDPIEGVQAFAAPPMREAMPACVRRSSRWA
jgi:hypothetical protein